MEKMKPITKTQYMENAVETLESQKEQLSSSIVSSDHDTMVQRAMMKDFVIQLKVSQ